MKALVVGLGSIGRRHVDNLLTMPNMKIIICTKQKITNTNPRIKLYNSLAKCLEEKPDVGFVTNVTSLHIPISLKLAKANIDLFLEKPLSNSTRNVDVLHKYVKEKKLVTQMGCNLRFHPCIMKIKELLGYNMIGRIISVRAENGSYLPDWHPHEDYRKGYAAHQNLGGGVVLTMIHDLDYLYWFFGNVTQVFSITGKFSNLEINADDLSAIILKFKNGIIGELHLDYFQRPDFRSCKIKGTKGTLYWDSDSNEVKFYNSKKKQWLKILQVKNYKRNKMYVDEINHFLRCVRNRKKTINDLNQGIDTLKISLAIKKASTLKKLISV